MEYDDQVTEAAIKAGLSGGVSGGLFSTLARMMGTKGPAKAIDLLKAAGIGMATGGGIAGGSTLLGSSLMGSPDVGDPSAFTRRAGVGGLIGGGVGGAILGAAAARGKLPIPRQTPKFIQDYFKQLAKRKQAGNAAMKGAAIGGASVGIPASLLASDEGMQVDFINNELRRRKLEQLGLIV